MRFLRQNPKIFLWIRNVCSLLVPVLLQSCFIEQSPTDSTQTTSSTAPTESSSAPAPHQRWNSFPHPPKNIWTSLNPTQPELFHGHVVQEHGVELCQKCHGENLAGGPSKISCSQCHPGYPTQHLVFTTGLPNPAWAGLGAAASTHHSKVFKDLPPSAVSSAVRTQCTLQCHTPLNPKAPKPEGECVGCHHNQKSNFSALNSSQGSQWSEKSKDPLTLSSVHHSKIFSGMNLPEKEQEVKQNCYRCHQGVIEKSGVLKGECIACHHQPRSADTWVALGPEHRIQWNEASSQTTALGSFHHKNLFQELSPTDKHGLLETTCATQCHTPLNTQAPTPSGDCVSCHHALKSAFSSLSALQADQWGQGTKNTTTLSSLHHSKIFSGMSLVEKERRVNQDCSRCHTLVNQQGTKLAGDCITCHHRGASSDSWLALSSDQSSQWNLAKGKKQPEAFHHKNLFVDMNLDQKNARVATVCTSCHTISKTVGVGSGECYACHHQKKSADTWVAFSAQESSEWKNTAFSSESLTQSHHKNVFSGLNPTQRVEKISQDCARCHTLMNSADTRLTGDCYSCHHISGNSTRWQALSSEQSSQWKKASILQPPQFTDIHHRMNFSGLSGSAWTQKIEQCNSCHLSTSTQLSSCMTCHHGMTSSAPDQFQTYHAYGTQTHYFARRQDNKDGEFHVTHHKHLFSTDFNSAEFQTLKGTCLQCHPVTIGNEGDELGFCLTCHHGFPDKPAPNKGYYREKIAKLTSPNEGDEGWIDAHMEIKESGLINQISGYRKTCLLCHRAKGAQNQWLPRPEKLIQDNPAKTNCNSCHGQDIRLDENGNLFAE